MQAFKGFKAKAKDLRYQGQSQGLDFGLKDQDQGQGLTSLRWPSCATCFA